MKTINKTLISAILTLNACFAIQPKEETAIAEKKREIQELSQSAYRAARLAGMARLDFMQSREGTLYLTEINPIPGSLAFYLWEAAGIPFSSQITDAIEAAVARALREEGRTLEYQSDIIERFTNKK